MKVLVWLCGIVLCGEVLASGIKTLRTKAEAGDAVAQNNLGFAYEQGKEVRQDFTEAFKWYRKSAEQGNAVAQCNLACCYANGEGVEQNDKKALEWNLKSAKQGFAAACYNLGEIYELGKGVERDDREAGYWYRTAAEKGDLTALFQYGFFLENGRGLLQGPNYLVAARIYREAICRGSALAKARINAFPFDPFPGEKLEDLPPFKGIPETGRNDATAMCELGVRHLHGWGVPKDKAKAMRLFKKAAEKGAPIGMLYYGILLTLADKTEEAIPWLLKASEHGVLAARFSLGCMSNDPKVAKLFLQSVAESGHPIAQLLLYNILSKPVDLKGEINPLYNPIEAVCWLRKLAEQKLPLTEYEDVYKDAVSRPSPQYLLGMHFLRGQQVVKDLNEAKRWFRSGAKLGCTFCKRQLQETFKEPSPMPTSKTLVSPDKQEVTK